MKRNCPFPPHVYTNRIGSSNYLNDIPFMHITKQNSPVHVLPYVFCVLFLLSCSLVSAFDTLEFEPEGDVGLETESPPVKNKFEIPILTIKAIPAEPPVIDGILDDSFWENTRKFDLNIELYPIRLAPAVVQTEARLGATSTHLYVAFTAHDPRPEEIRSALREHDASKEDDYVSIVIDPTGTLAKKYEFRVNPDGTLSDVLQDAISDRYIYDWDTHWNGAAKRTKTGYTVEMAIPANAIHSPKHGFGEDSHGFVLLKRSYPRSVDKIFATFFRFDRTGEKSSEGADTLSSINLHTPDKRDIAGLPPRLSLTPHYIYHFDETRDIGGEFEQSEDRDEHSFGIDAEYAFSTSTSLALTINPNFTEVEADVAQQSINNPFTIFQPEKRSFFKTTTEYYSSLVPVVYTRNIINPRLGASFVHDDSVNSYSAFIIDDRELEVIVPDNLGSDKVELLDTSYAGAFRYRHSQDKKTTGITATHRRREDGQYYNSTFGLDGMVDFGPDDKFRYQFAYSDSMYPEDFAEDLCNSDGCTEEIDNDDEVCLLGDCSVNAQVLRAEYDKKLNGHNLQARYKHDGPSGLYWAGYKQVSPDFRADLGFVRKVDIRSFNFAYGKKWYFKTMKDDRGQSRIRTYVLGKYMRSFEQDDKLEQAISFWGEFKGTYQSVFRVGYWFRDRAVNRIDQGTLDTGTNAPLFDERYLQWYFETAPYNNWKINLDGRIGEIADPANMVLGDMVEIKPKLTYRYGAIELTAAGVFRDYQYEGKRLYLEQFLSLTALYRKNRQLSHRLLYLDNLTKRDTERWKGNEIPKEYDKTIEYTLTYNPSEKWKILTGVKLEYTYESDIDEGDVTDRQIYCKIERKI